MVSTNRLSPPIVVRRFVTAGGKLDTELFVPPPSPGNGGVDSLELDTLNDEELLNEVSVNVSPGGNGGGGILLVYWRTLADCAGQCSKPPINSRAKTPLLLLMKL